jgi:hypothetical protein
MNQPIQISNGWVAAMIAALLAPEAIITLIGLTSLWAIWAPRDRPDQDGLTACAGS